MQALLLLLHSIGQWAWTSAWTWDMSLDSLVEGDTWKGREWENEEVGKESSQLKLPQP